MEKGAGVETKAVGATRPCCWLLKTGICTLRGCSWRRAHGGEEPEWQDALADGFDQGLLRHRGGTLRVGRRHGGEVRGGQHAPTAGFILRPFGHCGGTYVEGRRHAGEYRSGLHGALVCFV